MKFDPRSLLLYAVTDRGWTQRQTLFEQVQEALEGGVTCVQLREKDLPDPEFLREALAIGALCRQRGIPFIVNDNLAVAVESGADGIHIGQEDGSISHARKTIGEGKILGVSVQTVRQAVEAQQSGADYLGVGAVFPTATKPDAADVPLETLREICRSVSIPVCAIGGISRQNLPLLKGTGIEGVALVSAIFGGASVLEASRALRSLCEETFPSEGSAAR